MRNTNIDEAGRQEYKSVVSGLKTNGAISNYDSANGRWNSVPVDEKLLNHSLFYETLEKVMRETIQRQAFYVVKQPAYGVSVNVDYNFNTGIRIQAKFGNGTGPDDICYSTIKLDSNGNLVTELRSFTEQKIANSNVPGMEKYETSLYVQREVYDEAGIERADYRYDDRKNYDRKVGDLVSRNQWGRIAIDEHNGISVQYPSEKNKSTFTERYNDNQMLLPNVCVVTRKVDGTYEKSTALVPIHGEYIEKLRHYNDPLVVLNPTSNTFVGVSDQSYSGMPKEDIIALFNEQNAERILAGTKTKESSPEIYEAIVQNINSSNRTR